MAAAAMAIAMATPASAPAPRPQPTWSLVLSASDGQDYVLDWDLSLGDCLDSASANGPGVACVRERD